MSNGSTLNQSLGQNDKVGYHKLDKEQALILVLYLGRGCGCDHGTTFTGHMVIFAVFLGPVKLKKL